MNEHQWTRLWLTPLHVSNLLSTIKSANSEVTPARHVKVLIERLIRSLPCLWVCGFSAKLEM